MNRVQSEYEKKLKIKQKQQAAFRRFIRGQATPVRIREYIGMNWREVKILLEARMQESMNWNNYGQHWVVDHVAPFWIFDLHNEADLKLLWHPDNLLPLIWKDNNHKQGDLRFSILFLSQKSGYSYVVEQLIERLEREVAVQDKYLKKLKNPAV